MPTYSAPTSYNLAAYVANLMNPYSQFRDSDSELSFLDGMENAACWWFRLAAVPGSTFPAGVDALLSIVDRWLKDVGGRPRFTQQQLDAAIAKARLTKSVAANAGKALAITSRDVSAPAKRAPVVKRAVDDTPPVGWWIAGAAVLAGLGGAVYVKRAPGLRARLAGAWGRFRSKLRRRGA